MTAIGKPFAKGKSGNPGGRRKLAPELREFKATSYAEFLSNLQKFGSMTQSELKAEIGKSTATMFELICGNILASASRGDKDARAVLLDRLWGKVKVIEEKIEGTATTQVILTLPDNGRSAPEEK